MNSSFIKTTTYLGIFLLVGGISYITFDRLIPVNSTNISPAGNQTSGTTPQITSTQKTGILSFDGPKTEACPINGALFTKAEKDIWSQRRPLMVMIENHSDSRPQSGLQNADIVYEAVAEGGITRFMGVFYCNAVKGSANKYDVGPVRSARTYFLDLASEYSDYPLYGHVGGANCSGGETASKNRTNCTSDRRTQALEQISDYGWMSQGTWGDMNQFSLSYKVCRREPDRTGKEVATEHTMYCSTTEFWNTAASRGLTNMTQIKNTSWDKNYRPWSFKQADQAVADTQASKISFDFWPGYKQYSVTWDYDKATNSYVRSNGGEKHIDFNTKQPLNTKNLVVEYVKETKNVDEHLHNLYAVIGNGSGILFQNGTKTEITWSKANRISRTVFKDKSGKEVNFIPGQVWVEILPISSAVDSSV